MQNVYVDFGRKADGPGYIFVSLSTITMLTTANLYRNTQFLLSTQQRAYRSYSSYFLVCSTLGEFDTNVFT